MDPTDLIRAFVSAHKAWEAINRVDASQRAMYEAAVDLADCRAALIAFVEMEEKSKP